MNPEKRDRAIFVGAVILLVYNFIRALMPVDEVPSSALNGLSIALELAMFIGVVGMAPRILRSVPDGASRAGWIFLVVAGVIAGIGIFGIRLSGGPKVELAPRTSSTSSTESGLPHEFHEQLISLSKLHTKLASTRWLPTFAAQDPVKVRTLTRQDLEEDRELCREMRECADRILKIFADATAKGIAHSTLSTERELTQPEAWQAAREAYASTYEYLGLIEAHWDEWTANPFPAAGTDLKPWQLEIQRLAGVARTAGKKTEAMIHPSAAPSVASSDAAALSQQLHDAIESWAKTSQHASTMRWVTLQADAAQKKTRTEQDLREMLAAVSEVRQSVDRIRTILAEAGSQKVDVSGAWPPDKTMTRPEFWRATQQICVASYGALILIGQNWDEWKAEPEPPDEKNLKPWRLEMKQLDEIREANFKEIKALTIAGTTATPAPFRAPSPPGNNFNELAFQANMLPAVADYVTALKRLQATRWIKSPDANSYHPQKITRADLHDAGEKLRELRAAIDKVRKDLDAQTLPVPAAEKEFWRIKRETSVAFQKLTRLLEENWNEWHVSGIEPKTGEAKPWQKEALRLQGEVDKLKQIDQTSILL